MLVFQKNEKSRKNFGLASSSGVSGNRCGILSYYWLGAAVFVWGSFTNQVLEQEASEYFAGVTSFMGNVPWHVAVIVITVVVLLCGAAVQIEKANKVLMPLFFILFASGCASILFAGSRGRI